jgi:hypothetical protein
LFVRLIDLDDLLDLLTQVPRKEVSNRFHAALLTSYP